MVAKRKRRVRPPKKQADKASVYYTRLPELVALYSGKTKQIRVTLPTFLYDSWMERHTHGHGNRLAEVIRHALHFALHGPHPFDDPLDGLLDAFRVYEEEGLSKRELVIKSMRKQLEEHGIDPSEL